MDGHIDYNLSGAASKFDAQMSEAPCLSFSVDKGFSTDRECRSWSYTNTNPLVLYNKDGDLRISDSGTCQGRQAQEKTAYRSQGSL